MWSSEAAPDKENALPYVSGLRTASKLHTQQATVRKSALSSRLQPRDVNCSLRDTNEVGTTEQGSSVWHALKPQIISAASSQLEGQLPVKVADPTSSASAQGNEAIERQSCTDTSLRLEYRQLQTQHAEIQGKLKRVEASRDELARHQGQFKGVIAKLEGSVNAGERRFKALQHELEKLKEHNARLSQHLAAAQAQADITPERCRVAKGELQQQSQRANQEAKELQLRATKLERVLEGEVQERRELDAYASMELSAMSDAEVGLEGEVARLQAEVLRLADVQLNLQGSLDSQGAQLAETELSLLEKQEQVAALQQECSSTRQALAEAQEALAECQQVCSGYDCDRQQAASNLVKAEEEVDLISAYNEQMFRYVSYIKGKLVANMEGLDMHVPEVGRLARELVTWYERESGERSKTLEARSGAWATTMPARTPRPQQTASKTAKTPKTNLG